jgi:hypothetical protein
MEISKIKMSFGILPNEDIPVDVSEQARLFGFLFIDPEFSTEKVKIMLEDVNTFLRHQDICKNCYDDLYQIWEKTNSDEEYQLLGERLIDKIKDWVVCFNLPTPREILITCQLLNLSPVFINLELYLLFLENDFDDRIFFDYLKMFWETLDEELIDDLLDKYTEIKKEEVLG